MSRDYVLSENPVEIDLPEGKKVYLSRTSTENPTKVKAQEYEPATRKWHDGPTFTFKQNDLVLDTGIHGPVRISLRRLQGSNPVIATVKTPEWK